MSQGLIVKTTDKVFSFLFYEGQLPWKHFTIPSFIFTAFQMDFMSGRPTLSMLKYKIPL